jgi:hypothetical protein
MATVEEQRANLKERVRNAATKEEQDRWLDAMNDLREREQTDGG